MSNAATQNAPSTLTPAEIRTVHLAALEVGDSDLTALCRAALGVSRSGGELPEAYKVSAGRALAAKRARGEI